MDRGYFVISLDFELMYGVLDKASDKWEYYNNIIGARNAIPQILELFKRYSISATWATVGMLFNKNKEELLSNLPDIKPGYANPKLSVYNQLNRITDENEELFFARDLIAQIAKYPGQEIATHTYEHYYCTEEGQTKEEFEADLKQAKKIMIDNGYDAPASIVFPRNMCNEEYIDVLRNNGIRAYRGDAQTWYTNLPENYFKRGIRLLDGYVNVGGNACCEINSAEVIDIPASRNLYHYGKIPHLDGLKLHRIKHQMKYAAIHKKVFHLWWHPHNFGVRISENLKDLQTILEYYQYLQQKYNMSSVNMGMLSEQYSR